ncbi:hypothetical protein C2S51_023684 [Perilla frutescens var. frutescens]|nr:hypothetical protein C2S51_023684 [Perilla frutescens var. frutescens]
MSSKGSVSLKLLIDKKRNSVIFAEASETFAGLLSDMLSLPVGKVVSLLRQEEMAAGCLANLCKSIQNMDINLIPPPPPVTVAKKFYHCSYCDDSDFSDDSVDSNIDRDRKYYSDDPSTRCLKCRRSMKTPYAAPPREGVARAPVNYMITDDLEVMPSSAISIMNLLNKFGVKDVSALEEKMVHLGIHEAVKVLSGCMQSKRVLTDVFLTPKRLKTDPVAKGKGIKRELGL